MQAYRFGEFWSRGFVVELWHELLTSTAVASLVEPDSFTMRKPSGPARLGCCQQLIQSLAKKNPLQQATYQHDSSICTMNQTTIRVKLSERDCQRYTALIKFCHLSILRTACNW